MAASTAPPVRPANRDGRSGPTSVHADVTSRADAATMPAYRVRCQSRAYLEPASAEAGRRSAAKMTTVPAAARKIAAAGTGSRSSGAPRSTATARLRSTLRSAATSASSASSSHDRWIVSLNPRHVSDWFVGTATPKLAPRPVVCPGGRGSPDQW